MTTRQARFKRIAARTATTVAALIVVAAAVLAGLWNDRAELGAVEWPTYPEYESRPDTVTLTWLGVSTLLFDDGRPAVTADYPVAARSRFTIAVGDWHPETAGSSFGAVIEQLGEPTGIVVESAVYHDSGGAAWAAGRGGIATPMP